MHVHYMPEATSDADILQSMDKAGVEACVMLAVPDHERYSLKKFTGTNKKVAELVKAHPDRIIGAVYIDPRNNMEAQTTIRHYRDLGFPMAKAWPPHGFSIDDPSVYPVWEVLNELKMGILFHMGGSLGVLKQGPLSVIRSCAFNAKFGRPEYLDQPARFFPDVQFVIGHAAYPWTLEALVLSYMHDNVYLDFSSRFGREGYNMIKTLKPEHGINWQKQMFGSDSAGDPGPALDYWLAQAETEPLKENANSFFYDNAVSFLKKIGHCFPN